MSKIQIQIKNGWMQASYEGEVVAEALRFYKYQDGFSGWVVRSMLDKHNYSDPIPNRRQAWRALKELAEVESGLAGKAEDEVEEAFQKWLDAEDGSMAQNLAWAEYDRLSEKLVRV